eukprot:scaffold1518_cov109-Isochrysis_galbana.AAC.6
MHSQSQSDSIALSAPSCTTGNRSHPPSLSVPTLDIAPYTDGRRPAAARPSAAAAAGARGCNT